MINVLLTDHHEQVRTGIRRVLENSKQVRIVGEAECGEDCLKLAQSLKPDVILMDVNMPGIGGVETCRRILLRNPKQKIIVFTVHNEQTSPNRLLGIGAKGYLTKESGVDELIKAIKQVNSGGCYMTRSIALQWALFLLPGHDVNSLAKLSRREFQVLLKKSLGVDQEDNEK